MFIALIAMQHLQLNAWGSWQQTSCGGALPDECECYCCWSNNNFIAKMYDIG